MQPKAETADGARVLAIGLDGATWRLITPLLAAGDLPNLAELMARGSSGSLQSTIQPSSEQAWATFMTGQNNGRHGVYGFQQRRPGTYQFDYVNARSIKTPTLWQILSQRRRDVIVLNVPMTYPPAPLRGVLVGGLLSPGTDSSFTYPEGIYQELCQACGDYMIDVDTERGRLDDASLDQLAADGIRMIQLRTCAALHLGRTRPWDILMVMFGASDRLAHKFWKYWDTSHPLYDPSRAEVFGDVLPGIYRQLDAAVGELVQAFADQDTSMFVLSDHGFGPLHKAVYLNRWLQQQGYQVLRSGVDFSPSHQLQVGMRGALRRASRFLDNRAVAGAKDWAFQRFPRLKGSLYSSMAFAQVDWSRTQAYALGTMGNIYLNLQGREPGGIVVPGEEADRLVGQLMNDLAGLTDPDTGEAVFFHIQRGDDLYDGPEVGRGPDIVGVKESRYHVVTADWQSGTEILVSLGDAMHFVSDQSGQHELEGILMAAGPGVRCGAAIDGARLMDLAPTILYALREPIPKSMDGRLLAGLYDADYLRKHPVTFADDETDGDSGDRAGGVPAYSEEEKALLRDHLASLGYLD
ncbi:MAG: alkaline phosphatase family protein [Chloroflexota bacterium]|nr:alkaline phosphatase family protein [Chloroflexota bacterium]